MHRSKLRPNVKAKQLLLTHRWLLYMRLKTITTGCSEIWSGKFPQLTWECLRRFAVARRWEHVAPACWTTKWRLSRPPIGLHLHSWVGTVVRIVVSETTAVFLKNVLPLTLIWRGFSVAVPTRFKNRGSKSANSHLINPLAKSNTGKNSQISKMQQSNCYLSVTLFSEIDNWTNFLSQVSTVDSEWIVKGNFTFATSRKIREISPLCHYVTKRFLFLNILLDWWAVAGVNTKPRWFGGKKPEDGARGWGSFLRTTLVSSLKLAKHLYYHKLQHSTSWGIFFWTDASVL